MKEFDSSKYDLVDLDSRHTKISVSRCQSVPLRWYFCKCFCRGNSMSPTIPSQAFLRTKILTKFSRKKLKRGDIVLADLNRYDALGDKYCVCKRLVALPGDVVVYPKDLSAMESIQVYGSDEDLDSPPYAVSKSESYTVVPQGYVFLVGDNYKNSLDSRTVGPVPFDNLLFKVKGVSFLSRLSSWMIEGTSPFKGKRL